MVTLTDTLTSLSAMTTPAVLVLASGGLISTTSQRLSGSMDRQRDAAKQLRAHNDQTAVASTAAEHSHLLAQLSYAARRARLLQQAMTALHTTIGFFVASICAIGMFESTQSAGHWVITVLSMLRALLLFWACVLLIKESRLALVIVAEESAYFAEPKQEG